MEGVLEIRDLTLRFGDHLAVDNVSFRVAKGEFFTLVGPSGCGKTSTLRMIGGFEHPTSGDVWLEGNRVNDVPAYRRNVSTVFQSYALFPHLSALENVAFGLKERRVPDWRERSMRALELVRLSGKQDRFPKQLSGGEKQRVAVARSLVLEPAVLLLDEPLAALDPHLRREMRDELRAVQRRTGITFLLVTHDRDEALSLSDRLAVMNAGKIAQIGSPEDLYRRPASRFVAGFLGGVSWLGNIGIRPESVRIAPKRGETCPHKALVTSADFLGSETRLTAQLENGAVVEVTVPGGPPIKSGDQVFTGWSAADELPLPG